MTLETNKEKGQLSFLGAVPYTSEFIADVFG